ncbi:MAG: PQQ-binding-like beta-propeller repeat protein, partial [bacterium]
MSLGQRSLFKWFAAASLSWAAINSNAGAEHNWPQWRGPRATGVAPFANPPMEWSESKNIRWKIALPGRGHSTPIVWGDRIFITTAVPYGGALEPRYDTAPGAHHGTPVTRRHRFVVLAVNRHDGKILWQRTVHEELPQEGGALYRQPGIQLTGHRRPPSGVLSPSCTMVES